MLGNMLIRTHNVNTKKAMALPCRGTVSTKLPTNLRVPFSVLHPVERGISVCHALTRAERYQRSLDVRFPEDAAVIGKPGRFIQTILRDWANRHLYEQRAEHLLPQFAAVGSKPFKFMNNVLAL